MRISDWSSDVCSSDLVGRVLEMPYSQVDRISKLVPYNPANPVSLQAAIDGEASLQQMRNQDEAVARLIDVAPKLEGLYRPASPHAGSEERSDGTAWVGT